MSALMKWLAKHAETLSPLQRTASEAFIKSNNALEEARHTRHYLQQASPREHFDVDWLYKPRVAGLQNAHNNNVESLNKTFPSIEWGDEGVSFPDNSLLTELYDARVEDALNSLNKRPDRNRLARRYRDRE